MKYIALNFHLTASKDLQHFLEALLTLALVAGAEPSQESERALIGYF